MNTRHHIMITKLICSREENYMTELLLLEYYRMIRPRKSDGRVTARSLPAERTVVTIEPMG